MGGYRDYLADLRKKSRRGRCRANRYQPALWRNGPDEAVGFYTQHADLLVIRHRFSGRVHCTVVLPVGLIADLWGQQREDVIVSFLRKSVTAGNGRVSALVPPDQWGRDYPALCEYLYSAVYPDGTPRARSTVTVMAGDAVGLKIVLNDREESRSLWATGQDLDECWIALEGLLQSEHCPWRQDTKSRAGGPRKPA